VWLRQDGESITAALARAPCTIPLAIEAQGESFAWLLGSAGYVTISEGSAALHVTPLQ
jgi:hypothetical protein